MIRLLSDEPELVLLLPSTNNSLMILSIIMQLQTVKHFTEPSVMSDRRRPMRGIYALLFELFAKETHFRVEITYIATTSPANRLTRKRANYYVISLATRPREKTDLVQ